MLIVARIGNYLWGTGDERDANVVIDALPYLQIGTEDVAK